VFKIISIIFILLSLSSAQASLPKFNASKTKNGVNPKFDIPITYNKPVKYWLKHFRTKGKPWVSTWLKRSNKYLPLMKSKLANHGLPQDLAYIAMIESGFSATAVSSASAVGYWQFIKPTATSYGLKINWWIDERRDFVKSTDAAANYLSDLYKLYGDWYLTAAAYNMGETRLNKLIKRHKTKNFWALSKKRDFPTETKHYIPKLLASVLISKAPGFYGFGNIVRDRPYRYEYYFVPGGTDLHNLAYSLNVERGFFTKLNPELKRGFVPKKVALHKIRIPKGYGVKVRSYFKSRTL